MFTRRLTVDQVFPRLHLFLIQQFSRQFDFSLLSLRFFSFVSMIAAFFIWLRIAKYEFAAPLEYFTFVLSWTASTLLIYYSAELKPYSLDVLASSIFLWFLYNQSKLEERDRKLYLLLLMILPLLGLFSYTVFLFFIFPAYNLFMAKPKKPWRWIGLTGYGFCVLLVMAFVYSFDIRVTQASRIINPLWMDHFISFQPVGEFFKTFGEGTTSLFVKWFGSHPRIIRKLATFFTTAGLFYMVYGFFKDIKKNRTHLSSISVLGFLLYLELFGLGALQKYPFTVPRTSLFFAPIVLVMTIKGIAELKRLNFYLYCLIYVLYVIFLAVVSVGISRVILTQDFSFNSQIY